MYKCIKMGNYNTIHRVFEINSDGTKGKIRFLIGQVGEMLELKILSEAHGNCYNKWIIIPRNCKYILDFDTLEEAKSIFKMSN